MGQVLRREAVERHILSVNQPRPDIFIHSWATAEEAWLRRLYRPVDALFESNKQYYEPIRRAANNVTVCAPGGLCPFALASFSLSLAKGLRLVARHEEQQGWRYDKVVLYRPDVLLWNKDMVLESYAADRVTDSVAIRHADGSANGDSECGTNVAPLVHADGSSNDTPEQRAQLDRERDAVRRAYCEDGVAAARALLPGTVSQTYLSWTYPEWVQATR